MVLTSESGSDSRAELELQSGSEWKLQLESASDSRAELELQLESASKLQLESVSDSKLESESESKATACRYRLRCCWRNSDQRRRAERSPSPCPKCSLVPRC